MLLKINLNLQGNQSSKAKPSPTYRSTIPVPIPNPAHRLVDMAKHHFRITLVLSVLISLALVSLVSCTFAELKKTQMKDIKLDGIFCYLPSAHSFGFGIAALACLLMAQIIGNFVIYTNFCTRDQEKKKKKKNKAKIIRPNLTTILLLISWISCGIAVILLGGATSMNRQQDYGKGWLDGECYVVKQGIYVASGIIILLSIASVLGSALLTITQGQGEIVEMEDAPGTSRAPKAST